MCVSFGIDCIYFFLDPHPSFLLFVSNLPPQDLNCNSPLSLIAKNDFFFLPDPLIWGGDMEKNSNTYINKTTTGAYWNFKRYIIIRRFHLFILQEGAYWIMISHRHRHIWKVVGTIWYKMTWSRGLPGRPTMSTSRGLSAHNCPT